MSVRRSGWGLPPRNRKWLDALIRAERTIPIGYTTTSTPWCLKSLACEGGHPRVRGSDGAWVCPNRLEERERQMNDRLRVTPPLRHRIAAWLLLRHVTSTYDQGRADRSMFIWREVSRNRFGGLLPLYELRVVGVINGFARRWGLPKIGVALSGWVETTRG